MLNHGEKIRVLLADDHELVRLGLEQSGQFWVAWTLSMTYVTGI